MREDHVWTLTLTDGKTFTDRDLALVMENGLKYSTRRTST